MDEKVDTLIIEGAKIFLHGFFTYMRMHNRTEEEMKELVNQERNIFLRDYNMPLPDPPEINEEGSANPYK